LRVALQTAGAIADGSVVLYFAESIAATCGGKTRVLALLGDARLVIGTIVVSQAFI